MLGIKAKNLSVKIADKIILDKLDFEFNKGDFVILLGSNGSGKSTLLNAISGEIDYTGKIYVDGSIGFIHQNPNDNIFPNMTIYENYILRQKKKPYLSKKEVQNHLSKFCNNIDVDKKIGKLSGGQKQSISLGLISLKLPDLLLLDEHTAALDPVSSENIMSQTSELITANGLTSIMTTHKVKDALRYGNKIIAMNNGKISKIIDKSEQDITESDIIDIYCNK